MIRATYEQTFEDFREMNYASANLIELEAEGLAAATPRASVITSWIVPLVVPMLLFGSMAILGQVPRLVWHWVMPSLVGGVLAVTWLAVRRGRMENSRQHLSKKGAETFKAIIATAVFAALSVLIWYTIRDDIRDGKSFTLAPLIAFLSPHLGWIIAYIWRTCQEHSTYERQLQTAWDRRSAANRPTTVEASDDQIIFTDALGQMNTLWAAFNRYVETKHLFLLCTGHDPSICIPKRAFVDDTEIETFRQLLRRNIAERPSAFPVVPIEAPAENSAP